jgi:hypothetical protein
LSTYGDSGGEIFNFNFFFKNSKPQNMPILVDFGGVPSGESPPPKKKTLLLPKSNKFLFHFGDELNYASLTIDYY